MTLGGRPHARASFGMTGPSACVDHRRSSFVGTLHSGFAHHGLKFSRQSSANGSWNAGLIACVYGSAPALGASHGWPVDQLIEIKDFGVFHARPRCSIYPKLQERSPLRSPQTGMTDRLSLVDRFDACIGRQLELCLTLEALADTLPSRVDTHGAMILVRQLHLTLRRCHLLEETMIFPVLLISHRDVGPILDRLHNEHFEDEDHAADVRDAVEAFVTRRATTDAEEVGYMLRGLFTSLRRHLAFDRDYVLPLYRRSCGL